MEEEIIRKVVNETKHAFSFMNLEDKDILSVIRSNLLNYDGINTESDLTVCINSYYYNVIKQKVKEEDYEYIFNYISSILPKKKNKTEIKNTLMKCITFFQRFQLEEDFNFYQDLLTRSNDLEQLCSQLIKKGSMKREELLKVTKNERLIRLLECYCFSHNIKIIESFEAEANDIEAMDVPLTNDMTLYLKMIESIPLLEPDEQLRLFKEYEKTRSEELKKKLTEANLRLVIFVARRYYHSGMDFMDIIQEGNLGLIKAVETYKVEKGFRFATYAPWWIRQAITRSISDKSRMIRIPLYKSEELLAYKKKKQKIENELGREATLIEIAKRLNRSLKYVSELEYLKEPVVSFNVPVRQEVQGEETSLIDLIRDEEKNSPEMEALRNNLREELIKGLDKLSLKERTIMILRTGFYDDHILTLKETAKALFELGITERELKYERIRQIQVSVAKKLSGSLTSQGYKDFLPEVCDRKVPPMKKTPNAKEGPKIKVKVIDVSCRDKK